MRHGNRPLIGINCDVTVHEDGTLLFQLRVPYAKAIWKAGGRPILVPPVGRSNPSGSIEGLDGLLMAGGDDLDPERYGKVRRHPEEVPLHPMREAFDLGLMEKALESEIPLLAICLGIQEMAVAAGGKIIQYIPDEITDPLGHRADQNEIAFHEIVVADDSILHTILGPEAPVNSTHRQAVAMPGAGQRVTARAPDGVIEAMEIAGRPFAVGIQWHPELMLDDRKQVEIFRRFVQAAADWRQKK